MCEDQFSRMIIKRGVGVPTIPASSDHRNGDWLATDIYEGEFYMDTNTGIVYNRSSLGIVIGGTGESYIEVAISRAEALAIFTTPKPVLSAPGANKYYRYKGIIENNFGTVAFTVGGGGDWYLAQGDKQYYFPKSVITNGADASAEGYFFGFCTPNTALTLTADSNPTLGDGDFLLKLWYTIETLG